MKYYDFDLGTENINQAFITALKSVMAEFDSTPDVADMFSVREPAVSSSASIYLGQDIRCHEESNTNSISICSFYGFNASNAPTTIDGYGKKSTSSSIGYYYAVTIYQYVRIYETSDKTFVVLFAETESKRNSDIGKYFISINIVYTKNGRKFAQIFYGSKIEYTMRNSSSLATLSYTDSSITGKNIPLNKENCTIKNARSIFAIFDVYFNSGSEPTKIESNISVLFEEIKIVHQGEVSLVAGNHYIINGEEYICLCGSTAITTPAIAIKAGTKAN